MKEHPDYKYRPRRKPKSVIKKENKFGFSLSSITMPPNDSLNALSRGLLPPLGPPMNHHLLGHEDLKIPRFFPPFPYSLYPIQHKMSDDFGSGKLAADLAFQAIYGSGGSFYSSHQAVAWPGLSTPNCLQVNCGCPSPSKDPKRPNFFLGKPEERTDHSPVIVEDDRFGLDERRKTPKMIEFESPDKMDEERSQDRYSATSSPSEKIERTPSKGEISFSVQNLAESVSPRAHVI